MKISSEPPPEPNRNKAWSCLIANLVVLPGLGSVVARRKVGYLQMLLAIGGFVLTLVALIRIVLLWARDYLLPDDPNLYRAAIIGIGIFLFSWTWSLLTSLAVFRQQ